MFSLGYCFSFLKLHKKFITNFDAWNTYFLSSLFPIQESWYSYCVLCPQSYQAEPIVQDWDFIWVLGCSFPKVLVCSIHFLVIGERERSSVPRGFVHFISHGPLLNMAVCAFRANKKSLFNLLNGVSYNVMHSEM